MKLKLVVADHDLEYLEHFTRCIQVNYFDEIELASFSKQDKLEEYLEQNDCDVLMYSSEFETKNCQGLKFMLHAESNEGESDGVPVICKYQKMEHLYKRILGALAETKESYKLSALKEKDGTRVVSFLSASGGAGKTVSAVTYARLQALQNKRILYLSSETLSTSEEYFDSYGEVTMSQIFFAIKRSKGNIPQKIESALRVDDHGIYYFLPGDNPLELQEITGEDWKELVIQLVAMKKFDTIVVDVENPLFSSMREILDVSDILLAVTSGQQEDVKRYQKLFHAMRILEKQTKERWMEKVFFLQNKGDAQSQVQQIEGIRIVGRIPEVTENKYGKDLVDLVVENNLAVGLQQLN